LTTRETIDLLLM